MEGDAPTLSLTDEHGRSLVCYVERSMQLEGKEYVLLMPIDSPIEVFAWEGDEDEGDEDEMLVDIDDEELDEIFSTARAVLAEEDLILQRTALTLTASGELPEVAEEDIITLDIEEEGQINFEQFQQLASFFHEDQEYVICTPLDPLLFFARLNTSGKPELLSPEEFQHLLSLDEFKALQSELEYDASTDDEE